MLYFVIFSHCVLIHSQTVKKFHTCAHRIKLVGNFYQVNDATGFTITGVFNMYTCLIWLFNLVNMGQ